MQTPLTSETLSALAGLLLSLAASYLPGFRQWFDALTGERKRLLMLGLLALATAGVAGFELLNRRPLDLPGVAAAFVAALAANQAAYLISPQALPRKDG